MNAPRRHRVNRPARSQSNRNVKPSLLVVCEGAVTEVKYLKGIEEASRNSVVTIKFAPESGLDPKGLVEAAKAHQREAKAKAKKQGDGYLAYDQVWCVFDVDDHTTIADARQMARDNGIELAVSNPCIELWLLLHFEDTGAIHRDKLATKLKKHLPEYDKHVRFSDYAKGLDTAMNRAKKLETLANDSGEPDRNPTTGVFRLVEKIQEG